MSYPVVVLTACWSPSAVFVCGETPRGPVASFSRFKCDCWVCILHSHLELMVSETDRTKRALVSLLKTLAGIYAVTLNVTRESSDKDVSSAYRKLSR